MASSRGLPSGARPCAASDSRGLILAAQPVAPAIIRKESIAIALEPAVRRNRETRSRDVSSLEKKSLEIEIRVPFMTCQLPIRLFITSCWMKQQQFWMDRRL